MIKNKKKGNNEAILYWEKERQSESKRGRQGERELQEKRQTGRTNLPEQRTDEVRKVLS